MTKSDYQKIIDYLYQNQDLEYRDFHLSLKGASDMIGVRTPILKKIAKEISKNDYIAFIKLNEKKYYEEKAILAYMLGYLKIDFDNVIKLLDENIDYFDSWALTDGLCSNLKIFKKYQKEGFNYINKLLEGSNPWHVRIGLVLLLDYYINDNYIDKVLEISQNISNSDYYVMMANAWLVSICYIKYPIKTQVILDKLDNITRRKAISKINDSRRVKGKLSVK